jgi:bis(5'-nucleosidyl)-tetraphosphatase
MKHQYSAGVITYTIKNDQIVYLLLRYGAGHWDLPKGKIEPEETKQEAALRELMEETGLTAHLDDNFEETVHYIFTDYDKQLTQKTVYFFTGQTTNTHVVLSHEHTDFAWLPYKEALEQLTYDNAKVLLKKAHKHLLSHK